MVEFENVKNGGCRFLIKSSSGAHIFQSSTFDSENKARTIFKEISSNPVLERKTNYQGRFVIDIFTPTGTLVGRSKTYTSEAGMENGIKNVKLELENSQVSNS